MVDALRVTAVAVSVAATLALPAPASAQIPGAVELTEPFTRTVPMSRSGTLALLNQAGDVVISGGGGAEVTVDAVKRVRLGASAQARTDLLGITIAVSETGGGVEIRTEIPEHIRRTARVDLVVTLPDTASVTVRTEQGNLQVTGVRGELRASAVFGNITAASVGNLREARTVSGDVDMTDVEGEDLTAGALKGNVVGRNLKVARIDVDVPIGDIRLANVESDDMYLRSVNGNVDYRGAVARGGRYQLQSHTGDVSLTPAGDAGFELEAHTFNGEIRSDFPTQDVTPASATVDDATLRLRVGDGNASVQLRSVDGNIAITKP